MRPYILFDAGGTLVFPDFIWLSGLLKNHGYAVTQDTLMRSFSEIGYSIDLALKIGKNPFEGEDFAEGYFGRLMRDFTDSEDLVGIVRETKDRDRDVHLWNHSFPWVGGTLEDLKSRGYSMSVISNSDGRVEGALRDADLTKYMDRIYDSHVVGSEKPDPIIFKTALDELHLNPKNTVFVGDMFYIDVLGANNAGIPAVHLDPFDLYIKWPGARIPNVSFLPGLFEAEDLSAEAFFPFRN